MRWSIKVLPNFQHSEFLLKVCLKKSKVITKKKIFLAAWKKNAPLPIETHNLIKNFQTVCRIFFFISFVLLYLGEFQFLDAKDAVLHQEGFRKCSINYIIEPKFLKKLLGWTGTSELSSAPKTQFESLSEDDQIIDDIRIRETVYW